jgi:hypothetical protein
MSSGLSRKATGVTIVSDTSASMGGLNPWVHPDTVAGTAGWSKDATNSGLYDKTANRRYVAGDDLDSANDANTAVDYSWSAANATTGAVGWGQPRLNGTANLLVVFRSSSL